VRRRLRLRTRRRRRGGGAAKESVVVPLHAHDDEGKVIGIEPYLWWGRGADFEQRLLQEYAEEPNPQMERIELEARTRIAVG